MPGSPDAVRCPRETRAMCWRSARASRKWRDRQPPPQAGAGAPESCEKITIALRRGRERHCSRRSRLSRRGGVQLSGNFSKAVALASFERAKPRLATVLHDAADADRIAAAQVGARAPLSRAGACAEQEKRRVVRPASTRRAAPPAWFSRADAGSSPLSRERKLSAELLGENALFHGMAGIVQQHEVGFVIHLDRHARHREFGVIGDGGDGAFRRFQHLDQHFRAIGQERAAPARRRRKAEIGVMASSGASSGRIGPC